MRKPTVTEAVEWIVMNDEPEEMDAEVVAEQISVMMVADLFGQTPKHVARKVINRRKAMARARSQS